MTRSSWIGVFGVIVFTLVSNGSAEEEEKEQRGKQDNNRRENKDALRGTQRIHDRLDLVHRTGLPKRLPEHWDDTYWIPLLSPTAERSLKFLNRIYVQEIDMVLWDFSTLFSSTLLGKVQCRVNSIRQLKWDWPHLSHQRSYFFIRKMSKLKPKVIEKNWNISCCLTKKIPFFKIVEWMKNTDCYIFTSFCTGSASRT